MSSKKGDDMQAVSEEYADKSVWLSPAQVKHYVEPVVHGETGKMARDGHTEFNHGTFLVRSRHPIDELLRRGMIEGHHLDSGKRIMTIRDCAFGRTSGRIYNDMGEGDGSIDAMTLYTVTYRLMKRPIPMRSVATPWHWIEIVCFCQPDLDGAYFSEADYRAIYPFSPNIQNAFDVLDKALGEARESIKVRIEKEVSGSNQPNLKS